MRIILSVLLVCSVIVTGKIAYTYASWPDSPVLNLNVLHDENLIASSASAYVSNRTPEEGAASWKLVAVGDLMADGPVQELAHRQASPINGPHDGYAWILRHVTPLLRDANLTLGNLEFAAATSVSPSGDGPFNAPPAYLDALESIGFDILFTANNHVLDAGIDGTGETLAALNRRGIHTLGLSPAGEPKRELLIRDIAGSESLRIGFLNYTKGLYDYSDVMLLRYVLFGRNVNYALFSTRENLAKRVFGLVAGAFFPDALIPNRALFLENVRENVARAKADGAEYIIAYLHWGLNEWFPAEDQKSLAAIMCHYGVDAVLGSGPHRLQPIEMIQVGRAGDDQPARECLVAYSLANFTSGWGGRAQFGAALEIDLVRHDGQVFVGRATPHVIRGQFSESQQSSCRRNPPASGCEEGVMLSSRADFERFVK